MPPRGTVDATSTRHTCTVPAALPDATEHVDSSTTASVTAFAAPFRCAAAASPGRRGSCRRASCKCPVYVTELNHDTSRSSPRVGQIHTVPSVEADATNEWSPGVASAVMAPLCSDPRTTRTPRGRLPQEPSPPSHATAPPPSRAPAPAGEPAAAEEGAAARATGGAAPVAGIVLGDVARVERVPLRSRERGDVRGDVWGDLSVSPSSAPDAVATGSDGGSISSGNDDDSGAP